LGEETIDLQKREVGNFSKLISIFPIKKNERIDFFSSKLISIFPTKKKLKN